MQKYAIALYLFLYCLVSIATTSCRKSEKYVEPTGWTCVNPLIDSLTREVEMGFIVSDDSLIASSVDKFYSAVQSHFHPSTETHSPSSAETNSHSSTKINSHSSTKINCDSSELLARYYFWTARLLTRSGEDTKSTSAFNRALLHSSPSTADYIRRRIGWLEENPADFNIDEWYPHLLDELDYYTQRPDYVMLYSRNIEMFDLMRSVGLDDRARHYLRQAELAAQFYTKYVNDSGPAISRVALLAQMGDTASAITLNSQLLSDSAFMTDRHLRALTQFNDYLLSGNVSSLQSAYNSLHSHHDHINLLPKINTYMALEALNSGQINKAKDFSEDTRFMLHLLGQPDDRLTALHVIAQVSKVISDSLPTNENLHLAISDFQAYARASEHVINELKKSAAINSENIKLITEIDKRISAQSRNHVIKLILLAAATLIIILSLLHLVNTYFRRRNKSRALRLDLERILSEKRLSEIGSDNFQTLFAITYPQFKQQLLNISPRLSEQAQRLAGFVALGLSSKEIAEIMSVQPDSVKQARWRLRRSLNLPDSTDLSLFLRTLLNP